MRKYRKIIGICGSYLFNQQPIQFIEQLRQEGLKYNYCITAFSCNTDSSEDNEDVIGNYELFTLIQHIPFSGMIILTETIKNPTLLKHILDICHKKNIPVFSIDGRLDGCYNMVMNNMDGFEQMVRHVVEIHGCRRINMLAGFRNNPHSDVRIAVYKKVLSEHHIPVEEERIGYGDFWERPAKEAVRQFLRSSLPLPEAIICANDTMAIATCSELQKFGFEVPEDIIVTGYDGIRSGQYHLPVLTSCVPNFKEAATFIIHELENYLTNKTFTAYDHPIHYIPTIQQSCGCKPKTIHNLNHVVSSLHENLGDAAWHNVSMNRLVTANLYHDNIMQLAEILPEHTHLWKGHFRFACVKSSMLSSGKVDDRFSDMVSIMDLRSSNFLDVGEVFSIDDFIPNIDNVERTDTLVVRLLNSGKTVYGYCVEGFQELDDRTIQRCDEFASFLSSCLNTIVHNAKQKELTNGLMKANHEISIMSLHDALTGLYNRRGFYHAMQQILAVDENIGKYLYLFSIDMNHLKYVNDTFGHAEGDFAITTLANAISKTAGEHAICSRFGGDEFVVVLLHHSESVYSTEEFRQQMLECITKTEGVSLKPYSIKASIGLTCQQITPSINIESMIAVADEAMYQMKLNEKEQR